MSGFFLISVSIINPFPIQLFNISTYYIYRNKNWALYMKHLKASQAAAPELLTTTTTNTHQFSNDLSNHFLLSVCKSPQNKEKIWLCGTIHNN